ncbi:MAG: hypothetical protein H6534_07185, partial [Chthonomonadaceae bacterium]|nr:hypothetical protein [Chthonomonadaceae bacterium]
MLGLLPLTFALQLATPVSFDGSVGAYAAKISEKSDHTYLVAGDLRDEPILIRTNTLDLDSTRVRELVAQAIEGVWIDPKPGQSHLSIPPKQLAALRDRDREERQRALSNWLRELARDTRRSSQAQVANVLAELSTFEQREKEGRFTRNGTRSYQAPTPDFELLKSLLVELGS